MEVTRMKLAKHIHVGLQSLPCCNVFLSNDLIPEFIREVSLLAEDFETLSREVDRGAQQDGWHRREFA
jgi:hypothetical protein